MDYLVNGSPAPVFVSAPSTNAVLPGQKYRALIDISGATSVTIDAYDGIASNANNSVVQRADGKWLISIDAAGLSQTGFTFTLRAMAASGSYCRQAFLVKAETATTEPAFDIPSCDAFASLATAGISAGSKLAIEVPADNVVVAGVNVATATFVEMVPSYEEPNQLTLSSVLTDVTGEATVVGYSADNFADKLVYIDHADIRATTDATRADVEITGNYVISTLANGALALTPIVGRQAVDYSKDFTLEFFGQTNYSSGSEPVVTVSQTSTISRYSLAVTCANLIYSVKVQDQVSDTVLATITSATPVELLDDSNKANYDHIAVVQAGNMLSLYVNGALAGETQVLWDWPDTKTEQITINGSVTTKANYTRVGQVRLTEDARYVGSFVAPTFPLGVSRFAADPYAANVLLNLDFSQESALIKPTTSADLNTVLLVHGDSIQDYDTRIVDSSAYNHTVQQNLLERTLHAAYAEAKIDLSYPADTLSKPAGFYALRKVSKNYDGPCVRVARLSDNATQDINFSGTALDTASLLTFANGNSCVVVTWYDQSGRGQHLHQATLTAAPMIVHQGDLVTTQGQVALAYRQFSNQSSQQYLNIASQLPSNKGSYFLTACVAAAQDDGANYGGALIGASVSSGLRLTATNAKATLGKRSSTELGFTGATPTTLATYGYCFNGDIGYVAIDKVLTKTAGFVDTLAPSALGSDIGYPYSAFSGYILELIISNDYQDEEVTQRLQDETLRAYGQDKLTGGTSLFSSYGAPYAMYSVRKLNPSYTGAALAVYNPNTSALVDIGFDRQGNLDIEALDRIANGAELCVDKWYDQSGNGHDLTAATDTTRPTIYWSSGIENQSGVPSLNFAKAKVKHGSVSGFNIGNPAQLNTGTIAAVANGTTGFLFGGYDGSPQLQLTNNYTAGFSQTVSSTQFTFAGTADNMNQCIGVSFDTGGNVGMVNATASFSAYVAPTNPIYNVGYNNGTSGFSGWMSEMVIYPTALTQTQLAKVQNNQGEYFGVRFAGSASTVSAGDYLGLVKQSKAAYALRKINQDYTGNCVRVYRSSDSTYADIGFAANGWVDTATLLTFVGTGNGYIGTWYDQSGNSNNAIAGAGERPAIVVSGSLVTSAGLPSAWFGHGLAGSAWDRMYLSSTVGINNGADCSLASWAAFNGRGSIFGGDYASLVPRYDMANSRMNIISDYNTVADVHVARQNAGLNTFVFSSSANAAMPGMFSYVNDHFRHRKQPFPSGTGGTTVLGIDGQDPNLAANCFVGYINEVVLFNDYLTPKQAKAANETMSRAYGVTFQGQAQRATQQVKQAPKAAYSLRRVNATYKGHCITVKRVTQGDSKSFGFTKEGLLDTASILSFVGSGDGIVTKWFDQSGNGLHVTAADAEAAYLVKAGVLVMRYGLPALDWTATTTKRYINTSYSPFGSAVSALFAGEFSSLTNAHLLSQYGTAGAYTSLPGFGLDASSAALAFYKDGSATKMGTTSIVTNTPAVAAFVSEMSGDSYFSNVKVLLPLDGNIADSTGTRTWTNHNNVPLNTSVKKFGTSSAYFANMASSWLETPYTSDLLFGTGDFTIEFWMKSSITNDRYILDTYSSGGNTWQLGVHGTKLRWYHTADGSSTFYGTAVVCDDNWHHIAVTRASGVMRFYVDGVLDKQVANTANYNYNSAPSHVLAVGAQVTARYAPADFIGYVDDLRITVGVCRYSDASFAVPTGTPPTALGGVANPTVSFYHNGVNVGSFQQLGLNMGTTGFVIGGTMEGTASNSLTGYLSEVLIYDKTLDATARGALEKDMMANYAFAVALVQPTVSGFFGKSLKFSGRSYLYCNDFVPDALSSDMSTWTFEARLYVDKALSNSPFAQLGNLYLMMNGDKLKLDLNGGSVYSSQLATLKRSTWNHVAVVSISNVVRVYLNGELVIDNVDISSVPLTSTVYIGGTPSRGCFTGYMDEVRLSLKKARYVSAPFVPSSIPFKADGYVSPTTALDKSKTAAQMTFGGNASVFGSDISTEKLTANAWVLDLPDRTSYAVSDSLTALYPTGSKGVTFEFAYMIRAFGTAGTIATLTAGSSLVTFSLTSNGNLSIDIDGTVIYTGAASSDWQRVAFGYSKDTAYVFINGALVSKTSKSGFLTSVTPLASSLRLGHPSAGVIARLTDVKLTNSARYLRNYVATRKSFTSEPVLPDPYLSKAVLHLVPNDTYGATAAFKSSPTNAAVITTLTNASIQYGSGSGSPAFVMLNNTASAVTVLDSYEWLQNDFTFEMDVSFHTSVGGQTFAVLHKDGTRVFNFGLSASKNLYLDSYWYAGELSGVTFKANRRYKVALTVRKNGANQAVTVTVNGKIVLGIGSAIGYAASTTTQNCQMDFGASTAENYLIGSHSEVHLYGARIYPFAKRYGHESYAPQEGSFPLLETVSYSKGDPLYNQVSLSLKSDGSTFTDLGPNRLVADVYGKITQPTSNALFATGNSYYFDGTGGGLVYPYKSFDFTSDFTIEFSLNPTTLTRDVVLMSIGSEAASSDTTYAEFLLALRATGDLVLVNNDSTTTINIDQTNLIIPGKWSHAAVSRLGNYLYTYVNGRLTGVFNIAKTLNFSGSSYDHSADSYLTIGRPYPSKKVSYLDAASLYDPYFANNAYVDNFDGTSLSNGAQNVTTTYVSNGKFLQGPKYGSKMAQFICRSSDDHIAVKSDLFDFGTDDFAIEMMLLVMTSNITSDQMLMQESAAATRSGLPSLRITPSMEFKLHVQGVGTYLSNRPIPQGEWSLLSLSRTNGQLYMHINGELSLNTAFASTLSFALSPEVWFGNFLYAADGANNFVGYMDSIRVTKGVGRTTAADYTVPTSSFGTSLAEDPLFNSVILLLDFESADDKSTHALSPVFSGTVSLVTGPGRFGQGCYVANGYNSYTAVTIPNTYISDTVDVTLEGWFCRYIGQDTYSSYETLMRFGTNARLEARYGDAGFGYRLQANMRGGISPSDAIQSSASKAADVGVWHHVALVRRNSIYYFYLDGVLQGSGISGGTAESSIYFRFGDNYFGLISGIRLTYGLARYTSDFTVPTLPFSVQTNLNNTFYNGLLDAIRITNGSGRYNGFKMSDANRLLDVRQIDNDTYYNYVTSMPYFDSSLLDSANGLYWVADDGAAIETFANRFTSKSLHIVPSSTGVRLVNNGRFTFASDFTVEMDVYVSSHTASYAALFSSGGPSWSDGNCCFRFSAGSLILAVFSGGSTYYVNTGAYVAPGQWHHIAFARSGTIISIYLNGTRVGTLTVDLTVNFSGSNLTYIGRNPFDGATLDGYIANVRITKGFARYTGASFTVNATRFANSDLHYYSPTVYGDATVLSENGVPIFSVPTKMYENNEGLRSVSSTLTLTPSIVQIVTIGNIDNDRFNFVDGWSANLSIENAVYVEAWTTSDMYDVSVVNTSGNNYALTATNIDGEWYKTAADTSSGIGPWTQRPEGHNQVIVRAYTSAAKTTLVAEKTFQVWTEDIVAPPNMRDCLERQLDETYFRLKVDSYWWKGAKSQFDPTDGSFCSLIESVHGVVFKSTPNYRFMQPGYDRYPYVSGWSAPICLNDNVLTGTCDFGNGPEYIPVGSETGEFAITFAFIPSMRDQSDDPSKLTILQVSNELTNSAASVPNGTIMFEDNDDGNITVGLVDMDGNTFYFDTLIPVYRTLTTFDTYPPSASNFDMLIRSRSRLLVATVIIQAGRVILRTSDDVQEVQNTNLNFQGFKIAQVGGLRSTADTDIAVKQAMPMFEVMAYKVPDNISVVAALEKSMYTLYSFTNAYVFNDLMQEAELNVVYDHTFQLLNGTPDVMIHQNVFLFDAVSGNDLLGMGNLVKTEQYPTTPLRVSFTPAFSESTVSDYQNAHNAAYPFRVGTLIQPSYNYRAINPTLLYLANTNTSGTQEVVDNSVFNHKPVNADHGLLVFDRTPFQGRACLAFDASYSLHGTQFQSTTDVDWKVHEDDFTISTYALLDRPVSSELSLVKFQDMNTPYRYWGLGLRVNPATSVVNVVLYWNTGTGEQSALVTNCDKVLYYWTRFDLICKNGMVALYVDGVSTLPAASMPAWSAAGEVHVFIGDTMASSTALTTEGETLLLAETRISQYAEFDPALAPNTNKVFNLPYFTDCYDPNVYDPYWKKTLFCDPSAQGDAGSGLKFESGVDVRNLSVAGITPLDLSDDTPYVTYEDGNSLTKWKSSMLSSSSDLNKLNVFEAGTRWQIFNDDATIEFSIKPQADGSTDTEFKHVLYFGESTTCFASLCLRHYVGGEGSGISLYFVSQNDGAVSQILLAEVPANKWSTWRVIHKKGGGLYLFDYANPLQVQIYTLTDAPLNGGANMRFAIGGHPDYIGSSYGRYNGLVAGVRVTQADRTLSDAFACQNVIYPVYDTMYLGNQNYRHAVMLLSGSTQFQVDGNDRITNRQWVDYAFNTTPDQRFIRKYGTSYISDHSAADNAASYDVPILNGGDLPEAQASTVFDGTTFVQVSQVVPNFYKTKFKTETNISLTSALKPTTTIETWVKIASGYALQPIFQFSDEVNNSWTIYLENGILKSTTTKVNSSSVQLVDTKVLTSTGQFKLDQWTNVSIIKTEGGDSRLFLDGEFVCAFTHAYQDYYLLTLGTDHRVSFPKVATPGSNLGLVGKIYDFNMYYGNLHTTNYMVPVTTVDYTDFENTLWNGKRDAAYDNPVYYDQHYTLAMLIAQVSDQTPTTFVVGTAPYSQFKMKNTSDTQDLYKVSDKQPVTWSDTSGWNFRLVDDNLPKSYEVTGPVTNTKTRVVLQLQKKVSYQY